LPSIYDKGDLVHKSVFNKKTQAALKNNKLLERNVVKRLYYQDIEKFQQKQLMASSNIKDESARRKIVQTPGCSEDTGFRAYNPLLNKPGNQFSNFMNFKPTLKRNYSRGNDIPKTSQIKTRENIISLDKTRDLSINNKPNDTLKKSQNQDQCFVPNDESQNINKTVNKSNTSSNFFKVKKSLDVERSLIKSASKPRLILKVKHVDL